MGLVAKDSQFHVLAVDDSLIDRKLIERLLKISSFQVTIVDSGSKALEFLGWHEFESSNSDAISVLPKNHQEVEVNLVITDYCMPGMTGYDLLKRLKESSSLRNIPVVIMSSENVPSRINRCLEEGAEEFFLKPVRLSDVNKLRPHIMKTKTNTNEDTIDQKPEKQEKEEDNNKEEKSTEEIHLQERDTSTNKNSNNKRNSVDEGLSPDRTRPRYSNDLTVMSN